MFSLTRHMEVRCNTLNSTSCGKRGFGFSTAWHDYEIVVNHTRGKSASDWAEMMGSVMEECRRRPQTRQMAEPLLS